MLRHSEEMESLVFQHARYGRLENLRRVLRGKSRDDRRKVSSAIVDGTTPLLASCKYGHENVVEYLLDECAVDIEQVGQVTFDGENIDGAPPLWCASAAGHLPVVKALIERGANVNHTTYSNSTPLRAACFDGYCEVVMYLVKHGADIEIANRHGHTCLMISCYKGHFEIVRYLLTLDADVNRKSIKGNTALHDCAESGSLEIMRLLLRAGAIMMEDEYHLTPLLAASLTGHSNIVDYLVTLIEIPLKEKVAALELLGATAVDKKHDLMAALNYWKRSLDWRSRDPAGELQKKSPGPSIDAYDAVVEFTSVAELEELISDPDDVKMQALLIRERILGPAHPDTSYFIRFRGAVYADRGDFDRCVRLWMYALDMQIRELEPLCAITQSSFLSFAEFFAYVMNDTPSALRAKNVVDVISRLVDECHRLKATPSKDADQISTVNRALFIFILMLDVYCKMQSLFTPELQFMVKKLIYRLIKLDLRGADGSSLIHFAASSEPSSIGHHQDHNRKFPSVSIVRLLLECGADPNTVNDNRDTPLHVVSTLRQNRPEVFRALVLAGAHVDRTDVHGRSALDHILPAHFKRSSFNVDNEFIFKHVNLQCLAARVVRKLRLPYKDVVSKTLEHFIEMH